MRPGWVWVVTVAMLTSSSGRHTEVSPPPINFTFTRPAYHVTIPENSKVKTYAVADERMGVPLPPSGNVHFNIVSGDSDKIFKAEERAMGNFLFLLIRTRTGGTVVLNRERKDTFVLNVKATLTLGDIIVENSTIVTLHVSDRNDLRPLFYQTSYQVEVAEDASVHSSVVQIRADDADLGRGGEVYYRLREPSSNFVIHPVTGIVTLTRRLRYAEKRVFEATVFAQDRGYSGPPSGAKLTVTVKPVNLHSPEIFVENFPQVLETSDMVMYAAVTVVDKDQGRNGQIQRLEIVDGDSNGHFRIKRVQSSKNNTFEYNIATYKILNRERYSKLYNLTLKATDKGNPPRSSLLSVNVKIEPIIQKTPIFEKEIFETSVMESAPINSPIIRLKMAESEQMYHNEVHLEIVGGNEEKIFRINPQTGMLYTTTDLDAEGKNLYILTVSALEQGKSGFSMQSSAKVKINIVDINDNDPIFEVAVMNVSVTVTENEPPGTVIAKVIAKDRDSGENGYISYSIANLNPVPFEIDHFTGVIRTIETLDYETMRRESLLYVRASDWGLPFRRQTEMELRIKLRDVNDNKPQFERVNCSGTLSRYAPIGTEVMSLTAIDFDSGNIISYRIVSKNTEGCFNLDLTSGILSLACDLRYENFTEKTLNTTATDGVHYSDINQIHIKIVNDLLTRRQILEGDNFHCKETGVAKQLKENLAKASKSNMVKSPDHRDISVMPKRYGENVHAPDILNLPATIQVNESVPLGSKIIKIQAKDRDLGYNGKLVYGVVSGDNDSLFRLDPENGILKVVGHLDYEKDTEYTLNIVVLDLGKPQKSSTSYLTVIVVDSNDNPPRFQQPMASIKITENTANGTAIFKAIATDLDSAENAQISYSMVTDTDTFIIHPTTGVLYVNTPPDREESSCYEIRIRASDHGTNHHSATALHAESLLLVYVDDVNDNPPSFVRTSLTVRVKEDMPVGSVVAVLEAMDPDLGVNGEVVFATGPGQSFTVEQLSGALRLTRPLDYEERHVIVVDVTACDRGTPPLCASANVTVKVVDVDENAHPPVFADWAVSASVAENLPPGTTVTVVHATDDDPPGEDSRVSYYIAGGDGVGYFSIDDHGVIRTTSLLDAESENHFWLTVFAQDHGLVPLRTRLEVYVSVTNVNDNVPLTEAPVYYPHVAEHAPAHTSVLQLTAEDADLDVTSITFNITAGNVEGFFEIDHYTGLLSTTRNKLDREYQTEHDLEITISDNGEPPLWSTTRVVVIVDDVNDHAPQFEQSYYEVKVLPTPKGHRDRDKHNALQVEEDPGDVWEPTLGAAAAGEPLLRVLATDKDAGSNAAVEYSIKGRSKPRFHIHPETGVIYSHKPFSVGQDFELMVKATDHGFPNKSSTARIVIKVEATPDAKGAPFVKQRLQRVEVTESDPVGFLVALIEATSESDYLWFRIVDGNPRGEFVMGGDPGSVLLAKQLDCETQVEYNLTVTVSNGVHSVLCQVLVIVLDMNEHRPEFAEEGELRVSVSEAAPVGQEVVTVRGSDADCGGSLVYDLHNAQSPASLGLFSLDHETGRLVVTGPLDREHSVKHVMTVVAKDNGTPSKRNYQRLVVTVEDSNNHAPQWSHRLVQGYVLESADRGATVLDLRATDRDRGDNAQIRYSILSGNIGNMFEIHPSLGTLSLGGAVAAAGLSEYMLTVQAVDLGMPPLSSSVPVHILVIAADETSPRFAERLVTVQVYENERAGWPVEHLEARASSSVLYEIIDGNEGNVFTINPSTGSLTTLAQLDRELQDRYNLTVAATNSAGTRAECNLLVNVLDRNDNAPQLTAMTYEGVVPEDAPVGSLVMTNGTSPLIIYATDADSQVNALLWFKILEPAAAAMFYIDGFTGTIRTKSQLDYEATRSVTFTVRVFDLGEPQLSSDVTARVSIAVQDVNDCMPRFLETEYNLSLLVPSYPDARLLQVEAVDDDTPAVTELRYMILAGNQDSWFSLQPETGLLSVRGLLPSQPKLGRPLRLAVSDGRYSAQTRVNIKWLDSGNSQLQFQHPVYQGYVTENSTKPVTVTVVSVVGEELNQHIQFRLANPTPLFHLGLTSGALVTTGVPFDREDKDLFTIYVEAEYEDSQNAKQLIQTLVNISVVDVNDNCPEFMNTPYIVAVSVGSHKHTPFFKVLAIDLDEGENGEVRYELTRGHGELFRVDRKTGEVSLKQALQATQEAYIIIITAYDGGVTPCSTEATLVVKVVPETSPRFERQLYTVTVPESLPPHSLLPLRVVAEAPFGHQVTYAVLDNDDRFSIDVLNGALFTKEPLDYETAPLLEVRVRATDSLSGATTEALVTVVLTDVNDCPPAFQRTNYNVSVLESTVVGTLVARILAQDNDTGANGVVHYSVSPPPPHGVLKVDPRDGSLYLQHSLDRELNSSFHLVITATDGGLPRLSTTASITLHVLDVNDNPPKFERPTYSCRVSAEAPAGHLVTVVHAKDPDLGPLSYLIVAGNDHHTFRINPQTGLISVFNILRLPQPHPHVLNVSVTDGVHTRFCKVSVHVLLTNDHAPAFPPGQLEVIVAENQSASVYVATVAAHDPDPEPHGKITYAITTELMRSFFRINADTGVMVTERPLDRERHDVMEVAVVAVDGGGRTDFTTVRVIVSDVNDNAPEFLFSEYHVCVPANLSVESVFLKVKARDRDAGAAGAVEYSIYNLQSKRVKHLFGINPQTGSISLLQTVSSLESQHFQFFVRAADGGAPPLFSDVAVNVHVMRPGDTPPTFHRRDQRVYVAEDAAPGTVVAQVKLVTPMSVDYKLLAETSQFSIDNDGVIKVTSALDRETAASHTLGVLALRSPLSGFTEVYVSVVDVNDNPPRFQSAVYNVRVAENVAEGTSIIRVSAEDEDEGGAGEVRYSIASAVLTVDPYSGWVSVASALDRESAPRHSAILTAIDNGHPALTSTAELLLDIVDYNDSPPVFLETLYTVSVKESLSVGAAVLLVAATDPDGAGLDHYIIAGDPDHRFSLRAATGQLLLARPLDRELTDSYRLTVLVSDSKYVAETQVLIHVLDVNDNQPRCLQPSLRTAVAEDTPPGSTVTRVEVEDLDSMPRLRYILAGADAAHFYFDQLTGDIKTAVSLDRESVAVYSLVAHVIDSSGQECTSHVTVVVDDVNDNAPVFTSGNYSAAVPVDYPPGSFVTVLRAVDSDTGINRKIRYSIESDYFSLDAASGLVQVARPLDKARYSVVVSATDQGDPPLSTAANLLVTVVDVNDNPPEFAARSHHALVSESASVGSEVARLSAISVADGVRSPVLYSIIAGNEFGKFTIEPLTDRIVVAEPLDYEETRQYLLTVLATDGGEHPLNTHTAVNITVTDANDNAPLFTQPSYSADVSELASPGDHVIQELDLPPAVMVDDDLLEDSDSVKFLGMHLDKGLTWQDHIDNICTKVSAVDADSGSCGLVRYSLVGDRAREFRLDPVTGIIKLTAFLDREKVDSYVLRVQARDSGMPTLSSIAVVHVTVTDANDNPPLFLQPNLTAILQEDKPAGWAVCQLVVTDADVFHNAAPFIFEILYDDSGGKFRIDSKGVLQTLTQFNRQSKDTFHLQVRVYDSGSPPLYSDSWITIKVIEESQFPPEPWPLCVTVVSYEDRWGGGELGQVTASDRDPYDTLRYELLPASSLFTIDPQHGVVEASSALDAGRYLLNVSVSDGKFSQQVSVEVTVQPLWEENLQHAVSLRLIGMTPERFLLEESLNLVRTIESVTLRNVSIGSIQKTSSKYLDVLIIIMGGLDMSTAADVLQTLGLTAAPPGCSCRNGAKCRQRVVVSPQSQLSVRANTSVFISPAHSFTLYCACALGFTGDLCEDQLPAVSECACSGPQTCLDPPCVAPSCANNHSCFPPNITSGAAVSSQELLAIAATAATVVAAVALFVLYRRCRGGQSQPKQRRGQNKPPGAVDKLDITEISGSYCQHDILAGISLNSLPRAGGLGQPSTDLDNIAEETAVTSSMQEDRDVESYGFPSIRHPTLPDLQSFQVS